MEESGRLNFVALKTAKDFIEASATWSNRDPVHVFLNFPMATVASRLVALCRDDRIYSIAIAELSDDVGLLIADVIGVPVFVIASSEAAETNARELVSDPYAVAARAVNGEDVVQSYMSGNPT